MKPLSFSQIHLVGSHGVGIFHNEEKWVWNTVISGYYNFWYTLKGKGMMRFQGKEYEISPGRGFLLAPGEKIYAMPLKGESISNLALHFWPQDEKGNTVKNIQFPLCVQVRDVVSFSHWAEVCLKSWHFGDALGNQEAKNLGFFMLAHAYRGAQEVMVSPHEERIQEIALKIRFQPGKEWVVEELAQEIGLSRSQFTRCFNQVIGISPGQFIVKCRIERASQLITETPLTISEIANMLGYRDVFYFSRHYKNVTGKSPTQLREKPVFDN